MATDRCSCARSINAPTHVARVLIHARYGFIPAHPVGQGASEASGALGMTGFSADYQSAEPRTRRESLDSRDQLTQARPRVLDPPMGVSPWHHVYIYAFRHFCQNTTTSVHCRA